MTQWDLRDGYQPEDGSDTFLRSFGNLQDHKVITQKATDEKFSFHKSATEYLPYMQTITAYNRTLNIYSLVFR